MTAADARRRPLHLVKQPPYLIEAIRVLGVQPVVYVVDDDISVRESLELLFRSEGWRTALFGSAQDFLAHPREMVP